MRYWLVDIGNGYCGFEEVFVVEADDLTVEDCFDLYSYQEGGGGLDPYDGEEFDSYDDYVDEVYMNTDIIELTEKEFKVYVADGYEIR